MLINTVVLVLRDMLPLFILLVWLAAYINPIFITLNKLLPSTLISAGVIFLFHFFAPYLSELFEGAGIEFIRVFCIVILFSTLLVGSVLSLRRARGSCLVTMCFYFGVCLLFITQGANFFIYFNSYLSRSENELSVYIGVILALGFGLSFSLLFYFILRWLNERHYAKTLDLLWAAFLASLLTQIVPTLTQVDVISDTKPLWNSTWLIADSSEYGHVFKALIGYEATPSLSYLLAYVVGLILFYIGMTSHREYFKTRTIHQTSSINDQGEQYE